MATRKRTVKKTDLQARLETLKSDGLEEGKDYIVYEYPHGYIDVKVKETAERFEYRPDESEILRDPYGVEIKE